MAISWAKNGQPGSVFNSEYQNIIIVHPTWFYPSSGMKNKRPESQYFAQRSIFLASQDALEVMYVSESVSQSVDVSIDLTDVTLVSDDTNRRLY